MSVKRPTRLGKPARREAVIERRHKVFALRRAGATYESIAETCGISTMQAWRDCQKVLAQLAAKRDANVGAMLELELSRLDQIQVAIWPKVQSGDVLAARVALRVSELRGKLLGLDAPATVTAAIAVARDENRAMLSDDELGSRHEQVVRAVLAARQGVAARYYFGDQPPVEAAVPAKTHQAEPDASSWLLASRRRRNGAYPPG
jgi:hypothetical protein